MSYSINFLSASKATVAVDAKTAFDTQVIPNQPIHAKDEAAALANVTAAAELMPDDMELKIAMNGSITTEGDNIVSVSIGCNVYRAATSSR